MGKTVGAVLAAGAGRRYGMPKILAHEGDWLTATVRAVDEGGCDEVIVAMGAAIVAPPAGSVALVVADWAAGLSATIAAVLGRVAADPRVDAVLLMPVDTPDVGADVVHRLLGVGGGRDRLLRAVFDGRPGHPVIIGRDHFDAVVATLHGDVGAGGYLRTHAVVEVECGDLATGIDIDASNPG